MSELLDLLLFIIMVLALFIVIDEISDRLKQAKKYPAKFCWLLAVSLSLLCYLPICWLLRHQFGLPV